MPVLRWTFVTSSKIGKALLLPPPAGTVKRGLNLEVGGVFRIKRPLRVQRKERRPTSEHKLPDPEAREKPKERGCINNL